MRAAYFLIAVGIGVAAAAQAAVNGKVGQDYGGLQAGLLNFVVGGVLFLVLVAAIGEPSKLVSPDLWSRPVLLTGGIFGFLIVGGLIITVPAIGLVTTGLALIAGQLAASVVLDAIGVFGLQKYPISATRMAGVGLCIAGAVLALRR